MVPSKIIIRLISGLLLIAMSVALYISIFDPFAKKEDVLVFESTTILQEVERIGRLELVKYNFKEIFDYKRLSEGKAISSALLNTYNFNPDIKVILVATGEAVGCIDLTKLRESDIDVYKDSITIALPPPELCYHKLDMENTHVFSISNSSWWSRLFSDSDEKTAAVQTAYKLAERKIAEAAVASGILRTTNEQAVKMLTPMLEGMTGKKVTIVTSIPNSGIFPDQK